MLQNFQTFEDLASHVVKLVRLHAGTSQVERSTTPGGLTLGMVRSVANLGAIQIATVVDRELVETLVTDGSLLAALTPLATDAQGQATAWAPGQELVGITTAASVGKAVRAQLLTGQAAGRTSGSSAITSAAALEYFVSAAGNDANPGTAALPFATIDAAVVRLPGLAGDKARINLQGAGPFALPATYSFSPGVGYGTTAQPWSMVGLDVNVLVSSTVAVIGAPGATGEVLLTPGPLVPAGPLVADALAGKMLRFTSGVATGLTVDLATNGVGDFTALRAVPAGVLVGDAFEVIEPAAVVTFQVLEIGGRGFSPVGAVGDFTIFNVRLAGGAASRIVVQDVRLSFDRVEVDTQGGLMLLQQRASFFAGNLRNALVDTGTPAGSGSSFLLKNTTWGEAAGTEWAATMVTRNTFGISSNGILTVPLGDFRGAGGFAIIVGGGVISFSNVLFDSCPSAAFQLQNGANVALVNVQITNCAGSPVTSSIGAALIRATAVTGAVGNTGRGFLLDNGSRLHLNGAGNTLTGAAGNVLLEATGFTYAALTANVRTMMVGVLGVGASGTSASFAP